MPRSEVITADCVEAMAAMGESSVDAVVTDPPYGLKFMGKEFDALGEGAEQREWHLRWAEQALRALKPGGHLLAFGGTRTYHHLAVALEDAGFEIRDCLVWLYAQGFPKSHDVSKAIDKAGGQAKEWEGWGTALKPAHEPIVLARKPLEGTIAANVQRWGTGALNVDGSRIQHRTEFDRSRATPQGRVTSNRAAGSAPDVGEGGRVEVERADTSKGRWPSNVALDEGAAEMLDGQSREASRFFFCPKASKAERNAGLEGLDAKPVAGKGNGLARACATCGASVLDGCDCPDRTYENPVRVNHHPTVKPVSLMRWLVRMATPPDGVVLDPFVGSGTTGIAALMEGLRFVGVERDADYAEIARARIAHHEREWGDRAQGTLL